MSEDEILEEANRRYLTDPEFHARADMAAIIVSNHQTRLTSRRLDSADALLARRVASVALVVAELNPQNGGAEWTRDA